MRNWRYDIIIKPLAELAAKIYNSILTCCNISAVVICYFYNNNVQRAITTITTDSCRLQHLTGTRLVLAKYEQVHASFWLMEPERIGQIQEIYGANLKRNDRIAGYLDSILPISPPFWQDRNLKASNNN